MFGRYANSAAPFAGSTVSLKTQLLSVSVTAAISIVKVIRKIVSISSTATISLLKTLFSSLKSFIIIFTIILYKNQIYFETFEKYFHVLNNCEL